MAQKFLPNVRFFRHYIPFIISFILGVLFAVLFLCSRQKPPYDVEPMRLTSTKIPVTDKLITVAEEKEFTAQEIITEQPTVELVQATKEPYPPLIKKKNLLVTPQLSCPEKLFLLILVVTSSRNFQARKAIRRSWGVNTSKKNETGSENFRIVYIVGSDGENDRLITREAKRYKDILRGSFEDVYRQNEEHTVKPLFGLKWMTSSCKAKFVLKVSSETFVNVPELISFLQTKDTGDGGLDMYMGFCHGKNIGGANIVRNPGSPWYISEDEWSEPQLPPYASGMGILMSYDVVERVVELSVKVRSLLKTLLHEVQSIPCYTSCKVQHPFSVK